MLKQLWTHFFERHVCPSQPIWSSQEPAAGSNDESSPNFIPTYIISAYPCLLNNNTIDHDVSFRRSRYVFTDMPVIILYKKVPACLRFVLLETRQQRVKAPYEPSSWRSYLVKILRPIGHTSKIVFHLLPLPALHKSNGLLCLFFLPSLKESNKNTKRTKCDTAQG
jgi:hypothetical protein